MTIHNFVIDTTDAYKTKPQHTSAPDLHAIIGQDLNSRQIQITIGFDVKLFNKEDKKFEGRFTKYRVNATLIVTSYLLAELIKSKGLLQDTIKLNSDGFQHDPKDCERLLNDRYFRPLNNIFSVVFDRARLWLHVIDKLKNVLVNNLRNATHVNSLKIFHELTHLEKRPSSATEVIEQMLFLELKDGLPGFFKPRVLVKEDELMDIFARVFKSLTLEKLARKCLERHVGSVRGADKYPDLTNPFKGHELLIVIESLILAYIGITDALKADCEEGIEGIHGNRLEFLAHKGEPTSRTALAFFRDIKNIQNEECYRALESYVKSSKKVKNQSLNNDISLLIERKFFDKHQRYGQINALELERDSFYQVLVPEVYQVLNHKVLKNFKSDADVYIEYVHGSELNEPNNDDNEQHPTELVTPFYSDEVLLLMGRLSRLKETCEINSELLDENAGSLVSIKQYYRTSSSNQSRSLKTILRFSSIFTKDISLPSAPRVLIIEDASVFVSPLPGENMRYKFPTTNEGKLSIY